MCFSLASFYSMLILVCKFWLLKHMHKKYKLFMANMYVINRKNQIKYLSLLNFCSTFKISSEA